MKMEKSDMSVYFIIGPAASGKTYFRQKFFCHMPYIDLYDFQDERCVTLEQVIHSYESAKDALVHKVQSGCEDLVFEHTLLKSKRRIPYIQAIRQVSDMPIYCFIMMPDMETYDTFCQQRDLNPKFEKEAFDIFEMPTMEEGFDGIYMIQPIIEKGEK